MKLIGEFNRLELSRIVLNKNKRSLGVSLRITQKDEIVFKRTFFRSSH